MTRNSLHTIVGQLLKGNAIAFDKAELEFQIQSHPSYPSLHAVTGVLNHFNIENIAANVPAEQNSLDHLPNTFLAQLDNELTVVSKKDKGLSVLSSDLKPELFTIKGFLEKFSGVIVAVEGGEETEKKQTGNLLIQIVMFAVALLALFLLYMSVPSLKDILFLALSLAGLTMSLTIFKQETGVQTSIGDAFCAGVDKKKDCNAVLNSKGARVLGNYKFSDLSLIYFLSLTLGSFFSIVSGAPLKPIALFSLITFPITVYSIYYQWRVIKKWCFLCLSIVVVLWAQVGLSLSDQNLLSNFNLGPALLFSFISLTVFSGWHYLRPLLDELKKAKKTKVDYFRFKRNFKLFSSLLNQSKAIPTEVNAPEIHFGNTRANIALTIVTNPFCGHCKAVHQQVEEILNKYKELVSITIRFNVNPANEESDLVKITSRLVELFHEEGETVCLRAMGEIYGESSADDWLKKWSVSTQMDLYLPILRKGREWCETQQINFTPGIFINGLSYPKEYDRQDLVYFIEDLHEQMPLKNSPKEEELLIPAI